MESQYRVAVSVTGHLLEKTEEIFATLNSRWWHFDTDFDEEWEADGVRYLTVFGEGGVKLDIDAPGTDQEEELANSIILAVIEANGKYCKVEVYATCLDDLPHETYTMDEGAYDKLTSKQ